ncbi:phosphoribosylamine--glycine ligase [Candidatus Cloacimonadota bacterium]
MKIAVLGSGGREHAIAWKLAQSSLIEKVFVLPGNGGTENNIEISVNDFPAIRKFADINKIDLIFVGPEDPLVNGIVDYFADSPVHVFGPDKSGAQLEGSKIFSKQFMQRYGVATAEYNHFKLDKDNDKIRRKGLELNGDCVLKYDGLAAGKGVFVCSNMDEFHEAIETIRMNFGAASNLILEEKLTGSELSILAFTDGVNYQLLLPSQDHKQLLEGDLGPNTGGMGAFCPVAFCNDKLRTEIEDNIIIPTLNGIKSEKMNYRGVLYFGLMITEKGPKLLEYNVRLGDPETEVVLPALKSDLAQLTLACFDGKLAEFKMEFFEETFIDVVLVSGGYPLQYKKGYPISGLGSIPDDIMIFHAGTKQSADAVLTSGGRVINVVAKGDSLGSAIEKVYQECDKISFKDVYYRKDIGSRN